MSDDLAARICEPCRGDVPPLEREAIAPLLAQLDGWACVENHHLTKRYEFPNFLEALDFVNRVGAVAEVQNHHPDLALGWGWATVTIYTHKIDGLTESDFVFAAKCDTVL